MSWQSFTDIAKFLNQEESTLLSNEAENNMFLQALSRSLQNPSKTNIAFSNADIALSALIYDESLIFSSSQAAPSLSQLLTSVMEFVSENKIKLKRVLGPDHLARNFTREWLQKNKGVRIEKEFSTILQKLKHINPVDRSRGQFRRAWLEEIDLLADWLFQFTEETGVGGSHRSEKDNTLHLINSKNLFVWGDHKPVSMAGVSGSTPKGIRVICVYTPPEKRGNGYAKSIVTSISELYLSQGKEFLVLYTDATKPENTALYQQIGYQPIANHFTYFLSSN